MSGLIEKSKISPEEEIREELAGAIAYYAESVVVDLMNLTHLDDAKRGWARLMGLCIAAQIVFRRGDFSPYGLAMEYIKKACEIYEEDFFNECENLSRYKLG